jgi:hypothetical protein
MQQALINPIKQHTFTKQTAVYRDGYVAGTNDAASSASYCLREGALLQVAEEQIHHPLISMKEVFLNGGSRLGLVHIQDHPLLAAWLQRPVAAMPCRYTVLSEKDYGDGSTRATIQEISLGATTDVVCVRNANLALRSANDRCRARRSNPGVFLYVRRIMVDPESGATEYEAYRREQGCLIRYLLSDDQALPFDGDECIWSRHHNTWTARGEGELAWFRINGAIDIDPPNAQVNLGDRVVKGHVDLVAPASALIDNPQELFKPVNR